MFYTVNSSPLLVTIKVFVLKYILKKMYPVPLIHTHVVSLKPIRVHKLFQVFPNFNCGFCFSTLSCDQQSKLFQLSSQLVDSGETVIKPLVLTNYFNFTLVIHQISFPEEVHSILKVRIPYNKPQP